MSEPTQPNDQPDPNPNPNPNPNPGPWNAGEPAPGQPGYQGQGPGQAPGQPNPYPGAPAQPGPGGYNYPAPGQPGQPGPAPQGYAYQGNPYGQMPPAEDPPRPKEVERAFWLLIAGAVLGVLALPFALVYVNSPEYLTAVEQTLRNAGLDVDSQALADGVAASTAWAIITGILGLAVRVALAFLVRAGYNWARIIIAIYAALSLLGLIGLFSTGVPAGILTLLAALATIAAAVLLFMKPSNNYFTRKKAYRQAMRFNGYSA